MSESFSIKELRAETPIEKLGAVREWVETGIAKTLDQPGGEFLLGIESAFILDALDDVRAALSRFVFDTHTGSSE